MKTVLLVHYSEIGTKGKNRSFFEKRLRDDMARRLKDLGVARPRVASGRVVADLGPDVDRDLVRKAMDQVFGVAWYAFARAVPAQWEAIHEAGLVCAGERAGAKTFKVYAHRADKTFPLSSQEICNRLGRSVAERFRLKVDLDHHDLALWVEVLPEFACVYTERHPGLRGMPSGSSGELLCLFSGGIDSPVAAWSLMRRGAIVHLLHFHPFPEAEEVVETKITALHRVLRTYGAASRLYLAPHFPYQVRASLSAPERSDLVLFRRFMLRAAEELARRRGMKALITGDSLGQVASQTLENMAAAQSGLDLPVFMPLISQDKEEIVRAAQRIGTYELSIQPYKDCCSLMARHPRTRVRVDAVRRLEGTLDFPALVRETLDHVRVWTGEKFLAEPVPSPAG